MMTKVLKPETSNQNGGSTREKVLQSALRLFSQQSYFTTSIHDIRRDANVSIGSIYHHFKSKDAIAEALYESLVERFDEEISRIQTRHDSVQSRCRAIVELLFQMTEQEPQMMAFVMRARHQEFLPDSEPLCSSQPFVRMRDLVAQGIRSGEVRQVEPVVAAASVFGGPLRLIQLRLDGLLEQPVTELLDELWPCSWDAVKNTG